MIYSSARLALFSSQKVALSKSITSETDFARHVKIIYFHVINQLFISRTAGICLRANVNGWYALMDL